MFRNMVTSLFQHGRIQTTDAKAKELRRWADQMVTLAKRGDLHARRQALAVMRDKAVVHKLFEEATERFGDRMGGYTHVVKLGRRRGDAAPISIVELVTAPEKKERKKKKPKAAKKEVEKPKKKAEVKAKEKKEPEVTEAAEKAEEKAEPKKKKKVKAEKKEEPKEAEVAEEAEEKAVPETKEETIPETEAESEALEPLAGKEEEDEEKP
jgi:large subunit ribosomal protein L17